MAFFRRVLLVATIAVALAAPALQSTAAADDNLTKTLQQTVQRNNDEQVQAINTRNMSLVADTATDDYAKQLASALQTMLGNHVTGMALLKIDWVATSVAADGTTATVTTYETWRIMASDGISDGSIDYDPVRNDYTLVSSGGVWKIKSVVQTMGPFPTLAATATPTITPTATATPSPTPTATPTVVPTATPTSEDMGDPSMAEPGESGEPVPSDNPDPEQPPQE